MKSLADIYREHDGKVSDKWSLYLEVYEEILAPYRSQSISMLEIGVQNGGSIEIWEKYFSNLKSIIGCDIDPKCGLLNYDSKKIHIVVGDANSEESMAKILQISDNFEIIIDDGSHQSSDIVKSFLLYFSLLKEGGIFIAEDLHCSYWASYDGGIYNPYSSITFFKRLADILNYQHWGNERSRSEILKGFFARYECTIDEKILSQIHSIEFINSICLIKKANYEKNLLGHRIVVGSEALVVSTDRLSGKGEQYRFDEEKLQLNNLHSIREFSPDEIIEGIEKQLGESQDQVTILNQELAQKDAEILSIYNSTSWKITNSIRMLKQEILNIRFQLSLFSKKILSNPSMGIITALPRKYNAIKFNVDYRVTAIRSNFSRFNSATQLIYKFFSVLSAEGLQGLKGKIDKVTGVRFNEREYLLKRPDVAQAVLKGDFRSGLEHYLSHGIHEGHPPQSSDYGLWVEAYNVLSQKASQGLAERIHGFKVAPLISILIPTYNPPEHWLIQAIESVKQQSYPNWELCIADDASTNSSVKSILEGYAEEDPRIKIVFREKNGHISAASNSALALASGEWVALLDQDDLLNIHALFWVVDAINQHPDAQLIYSDEDKVDELGKRFDPYFKSDWNRDLFYSQNMISHLGVYKSSLLRCIGGFRLGLEGSQDYDLALRSIEMINENQIHHIPRVLYHWRVHAGSTAYSAEAKPYAMIAGERALNEHFEREEINASAELVGFGYRVHYKLPIDLPLVSLIIPTRNGFELITKCIESIIQKTDYKNYEIVIIDNGSDHINVLKYFEDLKSKNNVRVIRDGRPFNYSALNNSAVKLAKGSLIGLLNNDLEVISAEWLSEMVSLALQPNIGAVGARLWYPDNTLQHGGIILGLGASAVAGHAHDRMQRGHNGYFGRANLINSFSAVSAACLLVKKDLYQSVGGLNENDLQVAFNDVDFCLRLKEVGYRNVWTPYAELYHYESATRGAEDSVEKVLRFNQEAKYMIGRWGSLLKNDPAYNPNLSLIRGDFSYKWPPNL